jgi:hypothetical protein
MIPPSIFARERTPITFSRGNQENRLADLFARFSGLTGMGRLHMFRALPAGVIFTCGRERTWLKFVGSD